MLSDFCATNGGDINYSIKKGYIADFQLVVGHVFLKINSIQF